MAIDTLTTYKRRLPHWRIAGTIYFITWRLAKNQHELSPTERDLVSAALRHFDLQRYQLIGYVVMNDHVHVVAEPAPGYELAAIVHSWKSYTANRFQQIQGRSGRVWQREYFDRVIRDDDELKDRLGYILGNPSKRWPEVQDYPWVWVDGA
jgi:putative transposase